MKTISPNDFKNDLFAAYNKRLVDSIKRAINRRDPTIDWSKADLVVDFEVGQVHVESKLESLHQQIQDALQQVIVDREMLKIPKPFS